MVGLSMPGARESRLPLVAVACAIVVAAVSLYGATRLDPEAGYDGAAHLAYARVLASEGRLPTKTETYEYATPPGYPWLAVQLHRATGTWKAAQALSAFWAAGLVLVAWLLARELWPRRPALWAAAAAVTAGVPIVIRLGTMFHPEAQFAFFAALAVFLVVRAEGLGWPWPYGLAAGAALGVAALTRQTAAAVALALAMGVALTGGRRALRFGAAGLVTLAIVAGPWWGYQGARFGNPLESNLNRYILPGGQPRWFYVSAPVEDLVVHPYRPAFAGQLWPQFHADLWSDWFGGQHDFWSRSPATATRAFLSSQSVLGFAFSVVALAGLLMLPRRPVLLSVVVVSWLAFVVQLVRFPQAGGDPIKASYLLYLAPVFAAAAAAAGARLWARSRNWRALIVGWSVLYALSYAGFLATSW
ncbi:MAG TPA: glycosyltransferase family 39 protein [Gaiellaceae bacterium]|nr:glycosyltransferase family 39 protein [Gaiellaceae bacterium]